LIIKESIILRKHVKELIKYSPEDEMKERIAELFLYSEGRVNELSIEAEAQGLQEIYPGLELLRDDDTDLYKLGLKSCLAEAVAYGVDPCVFACGLELPDYEIEWETPEEQNIYDIAYAEAMQIEDYNIEQYRAIQEINAKRIKECDEAMSRPVDQSGLSSAIAVYEIRPSAFDDLVAYLANSGIPFEMSLESDGYYSLVVNITEMENIDAILANDWVKNIECRK